MSTLENLEHGHSTIIRLLEEVQSHSAVLERSPELQIFSDLVGFVMQLSAELRAHVDHEEIEVFPGLKSHALAELSRQHAGILMLLTQLQELMEVTPPDVGEIASVARVLHRDFLHHSSHERSVLATLRPD